ncbi:MAG: hypothetical protein IH621_01545 [Krumholzibacteria bacterium]|nr:hypothetical protein [Candidatus Krumholzibacteria bacterium]
MAAVRTGVTFAAMTTPISLPRLVRFWLPLQATWLMMAVEGPFLAAVIARLPEPTFNLAAYGVAFALAIIVEAPVIMMMSAATALVDGAESYRRLRAFLWWLNGGITAAMVVLLLPPVWDLVARRLIGLDPTVADLAHRSLLLLLPWPAAIGYRRFCQGLLIRAGLTRRVAWGTVVRLAAMVGTTITARATGELPGAAVGACALSAGVLAEALASRLMAAGTVRELLRTPGAAPPTWGDIHRFYRPLALTSTIALAVQPLVTFFMVKARSPVESLAVLPVINALVFVFRTPGLSYQEVAIALLGRSWDNLARVKQFAALLGVLATAGLAAIALTPLVDVWLVRVSGLSPELAAVAHLPLRIIVVMPALSVLLSLQRSLLVARRTTGPITWASVVEVTGIAVVLLVTVGGWDWVGATAAATAYLVGRLAANLWLLRSMGGGPARN